MLRKWVSLFILQIMLLPTFGYCLCQMPVDMLDCYRNAEVPDCCCNREVAVPDEMPDPGDAVLAPVFKLLELSVSHSSSIPTVLSEHPLPSLQAATGSTALLRSPPTLYLHHASFLI